MNKQFLAVLLIVVALLVGVFIATKDEASSPTDSAGQVSNHSLGAGDKGVTLIEYGDFQCPACKSYHPIVKQVLAEYGDDITFSFRHFPLTQIHNHAYIASRAAEAAGKQDKFFEMHDLMYENQEAWSQLPDPKDTFEQYAEQLKLDMEKFREDMFSKSVSATINADLAAAQELGATSTPTFVLNGERIENNPRDLEGFKELIDQAIQENSSGQ